MIRTFFALKAQYIKSELEYPSNFWMMLISGVITRFLGLLIPFTIYQNLPDIQGWKINEIYLMISSCPGRFHRCFRWLLMVWDFRESAWFCFP